MEDNSLGASFDGLLAAAQAGGGWALERLWKSVAPQVRGYLATQGVAEPDDMTSEVFINVFKALPSFTGNEAAFRSWLFTIAHRRIQDGRRMAARRPLSESFDSNVHSTDTSGADHVALQQLATERVTALCAQLAPEQRDVLLLRLVAGFTIDEIAGVLGKSRGGTKALQRRGVLALQKIMSTEGVPL